MSDFNAASQAGQYWNGKLTRREAQGVFDEQKETIMGLAVQISRLSAVTSYLMEKVGVTAEEINLWVEEKVKAAQAEAAAAAPAVQA